MNKEELEKEAEKNAKSLFWYVVDMSRQPNKEELEALVNNYMEIAEPREKRIAELEKENAELEEKISVLLSCKNCPENKGGLLCQKGYEDKCIAQKIQFIKELQKENAELKNFIMQSKKDGISPINALIIKNLANQLTNANEIIKELNEGLDKLYLSGLSDKQIAFIEQLQDKAEQFLKDSEVEK